MSKTSRLLTVISYFKNHFVNFADVKIKNDRINVYFKHSDISIYGGEILDDYRLPWDRSFFKFDNCYTKFAISGKRDEQTYKPIKHGLRTLEGIPQKLFELDITDMQIDKLDGMPKEIKGLLYLNNCPNLISLKGICDKVRDIELIDLNMTRFDYFPHKVKGLIYINRVPLTSLEGLPKKCDRMWLEDIKDLNLEGLPKCKDIVFVRCTFTNIDVLSYKFPRTLEFKLTNKNGERKVFNDFKSFKEYAYASGLMRCQKLQSY